eukprot:SAG31_NODE_5999_length_2220_cov_2.343706_1_plen_230_part_10
MFTVGAAITPITANVIAEIRDGGFHHQQHPTNLAVTFGFVAMVGLILALGPFTLSCLTPPRSRAVAENNDWPGRSQNVPRRILFAVAVITAVGTSMETMLGNFVYVYGVEMYSLSASSARDLNALSWGCQGIGRVIGIILSGTGLTPGRVFRAIVLPLGIIASTALLCAPRNAAVGWVCIPLFGVSLGPLMACVQGEAAAAGDFTGFAVTMIVVIQASCEMVVPILAVYL